MLLTRKSQGHAQAVNPLARAATALAAKTVDRRAFLKGTGLGAGAASFASQLPLNFIGEANVDMDAPPPLQFQQTFYMMDDKGNKIRLEGGEYEREGGN